MYKIVASPPAPLQLERGVKWEIPHTLDVKRGVREGRKNVCLVRLDYGEKVATRVRKIITIF